MDRGDVRAGRSPDFLRVVGIPAEQAPGKAPNIVPHFHLLRQPHFLQADQCPEPIWLLTRSSPKRKCCSKDNGVPAIGRDPVLSRATKVQGRTTVRTTRSVPRA